MIDPRRSAAGKRAAATRRRRKTHPTAEAFDQACRATEILIEAARAEGFEVDAEAIRAVFLDLGGQIDRRNGYDV